MKPIKNLIKSASASDDAGAMGYILAWLLGVPGVVLFAIFLLRGCN